MKRPPVILRLLAPIAVAGLAVVVFLVVASSLPDSDSDDKRRGGRGGDQQSQQQAKSDEKFYTVEPGDTLTTISDKTGIGVDKLTELNPDLDPQALISGEQVKLRK
jgi:LysM repeat protein